MVSLEDVERAQQEWGDGIVAISEAHRNGGDYVGIATYHINTLYAYQIGPVMFKPTLAACLLYTSPSPRDQRGSRMPSSA